MSGSSRVFVGRLSYRARESDVERFFRGFGKIREINLKNGYGFVEFDDSRDADDAVYEMNNRDLCGERVTVEHARFELNVTVILHNIYIMILCQVMQSRA